MPTPWADRVKQRGQLSIYIDPTVTGTWAKVVKSALRQFNALSRSKRLGVLLTESQVAPKARGSGGADVSVRIADGRISCTYEGVTTNSTVDGKGKHGETVTFTDPSDSWIEKAFVFLPKAPKVNAPGNVHRTVGDGVMIVIAAHEFVHACGLSNSEHSTYGLFQANPLVEPDHKAAEDRVRISVNKMKMMPPLDLDRDTIRRIRTVWRRRGMLRGSKRGALDRKSTLQYAANRVGPVMGGATRFNGEVRGGTRHPSPLV